MPPMRCLLAALLLAALAPSVAAPAAADWLVTRSGDRLETRGPWQVKGKVVVFTAADGRFSSLRLEEIDLEASTAATEAAKAPPAPPEPPEASPRRREPVLVITDADVPKARKPEPPGPEAEADPEESAEPAVTVISWSEVSEPGSFDVQIFGTLRNDTEEVATDLAVAVQLFGADGALLARQPSLLNVKSLPPGATTNFRAAFPGIFSFSSITFQVEGNRMKLQAPAAVDQDLQPESSGEGDRR